MTDDLATLRRMAEAATPGPWHFHQDDGTALDISEVCIPRPEEDVDLSIASLLEDRDGAFIAAANPATVLALLDRLERAERELEVAMAPHSDCVESGERAGAQIDDLKSRAERAEAAIERVRAVHGQHPRWPDKCGGCDGYYPCPTLATMEGDLEKLTQLAETTTAVERRDLTIALNTVYDALSKAEEAAQVKFLREYRAEKGLA